MASIADDTKSAYELAKAAAQLVMDLADYRAERDAREGTDYATMPTAELDRLMVDLLSHAMEEVVELRMCLPNRKAWKAQDQLSLRSTSEAALEQKTQALEELADVVLMLDAFRAAAGFTLDEVITAMQAKMAKNLQRQDHTCNSEL